MQKAPILKGSGLKPLEETKSSEEVHVFGKNLEERVIPHKEDEKPAQVSFSTSQTDHNHSEDDIELIKKRKFDAITGEEDEKTVFHGEFKLFVWDKESSNWMEKGRGQLKLNDSIADQITKCRLIMRISGTLRIILNVAIKQSTFRIIASSKTNIRFTDSLTVWAVSGSNVQQLKNLLEERLVKSGSETDDDTTVDEPSKRTKSDSVVEENALEDCDSGKSTSPVVTGDDGSSPEIEHGEAENRAHEESEAEDDAHKETEAEEDALGETEAEEDTHEETEAKGDTQEVNKAQDDRHTGDGSKGETHLENEAEDKSHGETEA